MGWGKGGVDVRRSCGVFIDLSPAKLFTDFFPLLPHHENFLLVFHSFCVFL